VRGVTVNAGVSLKEIATLGYRRPPGFAGRVDSRRVEVTSGYKPQRDSAPSAMPRMPRRCGRSRFSARSRSSLTHREDGGVISQWMVVTARSMAAWRRAWPAAVRRNAVDESGSVRDHRLRNYCYRGRARGAGRARLIWRRPRPIRS